MFVPGIQLHRPDGTESALGLPEETFGNALKLLCDAKIDVWGLEYNTWKYVENSALSLGLAVSKIREQTGAAKVNVISHSMGGLVTRAYLQDFAKQYISPLTAYTLSYNHDIQKFLMIACPNHGSNWATLAA